MAGAGTLGWQPHLLDWLQPHRSLGTRSTRSSLIGASFYFIFLENSLNRIEATCGDELLLATSSGPTHWWGSLHAEKRQNAPQNCRKNSTGSRA